MVKGIGTQICIMRVRRSHHACKSPSAITLLRLRRLVVDTAPGIRLGFSLFVEL